LEGDAIFMSGNARGGDDRLFGDAGQDFLTGDSFGSSGGARGGADHLFGGAGGDILQGDARVMSDRARGGNDRLAGGAGSDQLYGDAETVAGGAVCGADRLSGGAGDDRLWGDADPTSGDLRQVTRGADRFVFAQGSDRDLIGDFEDDQDVIDLRGYAGIDGFAEVRAQATQVGADTMIDLGAAAGGAAGADVLTLANFALARLDAADFLLG
jgi:Ca2+-binding RTX toxin-like protein